MYHKICPSRRRIPRPVGRGAARPKPLEAAMLFRVWYGLGGWFDTQNVAVALRFAATQPNSRIDAISFLLTSYPLNPWRRQ